MPFKLVSPIRSVSLVCCAFISFSKTVLGAPLGIGLLKVRQISSVLSTGPLDQSSDVWATVVANVAPVMALLGERNTKEFLRLSSSLDQLLLMASAPLGIISMTTGAIRLSGPRMLRRLVGRDSDRRSEALVELTPLSVRPASSVFTRHAVEIEPTEERDRVAFVCAHVSQTPRVHAALLAFKNLLPPGDAEVEQDRDCEIILGMKKNTLDLEQTALLITSVLNETLEVDPRLSDGIRTTSLSYRMSGVSPTQTKAGESGSTHFSRLRNVAISIFFAISMCGVQVAGHFATNPQERSRTTLVMGLVGYGGIAAFTMALMVVIKHELLVEYTRLPDVFESAVWTFSDSRHAEVRVCDKPADRTLALAAPKAFGENENHTRRLITTVVSVGVAASYIVFYLGIRVAPWYVAFCSLLIIWLSAAFRATVIKPSLTANVLREDAGETWLGVFDDNLYDSLVATVRAMKIEVGETESSLSSLEKCESHRSSNLKESYSTTLVVSKPIRQSLRNWSGCEDVMKVALEMAKRTCHTHEFNAESVTLNIPNRLAFKRLVRFHLMIYVPGILWKAITPLDYVMTEDFDLPNLYRDFMKIIHLSSSVSGTITRHDGHTRREIDELSNVLCGPVAIPAPKEIPDGTVIPLSNLLRLLATLNPPTMKHYTLEQTILLPTLQLATLYETYRDHDTPVIETYQAGYRDNLRLSGADYLPTMLRTFDENNIWEEWMTQKPPSAMLGTVAEEGAPGEKDVKPRDETSGLYGRKVGIGKGGVGKQTQKEKEWLQDAARQCSVSHMTW